MTTAKTLALLGASSMVLTACGTTFGDLPLPGKAVSGATYKVTASFDDALNLPVGATIKIGGVQIGKVQTVGVQNFHAVASMDIQKIYPLHQGATFRLRGTSPFGELFVEVVDSPNGAPLPDGAVIDTKSTSTAATIEDSLAATAVLLNGGSLGNLGTLLREANKALDGRQQKARSVLTKADALVKQLADSTDDITAALSALSGFSKVLSNRQATINAALKDIRPAAKVLQDNTHSLTELLTKIDGLSTTTRSVLNQTQTQLVQTLQQLGPIVESLGNVGNVIDSSVQSLVNVVPLINKAIPNDYANLDATLHVDAATLGGTGGGGLLGLSQSAVPVSSAAGSSIPTIPGAKTASKSGAAQ